MASYKSGVHETFLCGLCMACSWHATLTNFQRQSSILALLVSVLAALLNVTSSHYTHHAQGHAILKTLLAPQWMQLLNNYVTGSHNDLIMATLKLLNTMSSYAGGSEKKLVFEGFAWELKVRRFCMYDTSVLRRHNDVVTLSRGIVKDGSTGQLADYIVSRVMSRSFSIFF